MTEKLTTSVQSIDRAFLILETLSKSPSLSLTEISKKVNLHKVTTLRLVNSLLENGYIEKEHSTKQYRITLKVFQIGNRRIQNIDFLNIVKSMMQQLSQKLNLPIHLATEEQDQILLIDKSFSVNTPYLIESRIGEKIPLYRSAAGKAFLATKTNGAILNYWGREERIAKTKNTIIEMEPFLKEIEKTRVRGFAIDNEENEYGTLRISAVFSSYKDISEGALIISLPVSERSKVKEYGKELLETTKDTSNLLGFFNKD